MSDKTCRNIERAPFPGERGNPFYFDTARLALSFAQKEKRSLWTLLRNKDGIFHIYPGGRIVHYPWKDPRSAKVPEAFVEMVDKVLAYKPKPKSKAARKRKKRAAKFV